MTRVVDEIVGIFRELGFAVATGPEVETEWYNFLALNFPADHPAMDMHDTLYLDAPPAAGEPGGQAAAPHPHLAGADPDDARLAAAGAGGDPGHGLPQRRHGRVAPAGVLADRGPRGGRGDLVRGSQGDADHFAHRFFSPTTRTRFRPSFFPFTEPSAEMDVECQLCHGSGCPACKGTGWMEILGCGMVHPAVLENCELDPERYTGWAFGMGPHRIALLRYGVPDIRLLLGGDMRFLTRGSARDGRRMNVSLRWLQEFLRRSSTPADVADRLAMLGAPVDAVEPLHAELGDVVVAPGARTVRPHPNADRLRSAPSTTAPAAGSTSSAARPTSTAGKKYPFARIGTHAARRQGVSCIEARQDPRRSESEGMLCSARELGLGEEHDGILELATDAAPGHAVARGGPLADHRLVVDVGPNRPDLLGHKGVARELSASYGTPFRLPQIPGAERDGRSAGAPRRRHRRGRRRPDRHRGPESVPAFTRR